QKSVLEYRGVRSAVDYAREEGRKKWREEGVEIGIKKGVEKGKILIAKNCLKKGLPSETIAELTDLSVEEINSLKNKI
ncbi:hypothetical protein LJC52_03215, partial [Bacteroidales bacterium OttesenSCG-928-A17]|nr:hypothetical protein [Bacteroidales bacterium OttesenSCG-928-A17]